MTRHVSNGEMSRLLGALVDAIGEDSKVMFHRAFDEIDLENVRKAVDAGRPDRFDLFFNHPFRMVRSGLLLHLMGKGSDLHFLFEHADFVERHFRFWLEDVEGFSCCADKSRTIMCSLARYFLKLQAGVEERIVFDRSAPYTYHLPEKIFSSHEEILEFFHAIKFLYAGKGEQYREVCRRLDIDFTGEMR